MGEPHTPFFLNPFRVAIYLVETGIIVLKFLLYMSKEEQKRRFLEQIERLEAKALLDAET